MGLVITSKPQHFTLQLSFRFRRNINSSQFRHCFTCCRWLNTTNPPPPPFRLPIFSRFGNVTPRCMSANTDLECCSLTKEKSTLEELPSIPSGCSISVVNVISATLQTGALNLLHEKTYFDELLTTLPVLSEEEQNALSAMPAHPAGLNALYASSLVGNLVEQVWNFTWPAAVSLVYPSLLPVAVVGFFSKFASFLGGPLVGSFVDSFPRVSTYNRLSVLQASAQLLSTFMIIHALRTKVPTSASSVLTQPWFIVLILAVSVESLSGLALGVASERDWVVLLAGTNRPIALAHANAMLSRINLLCEIAGATLFGILLSKYDIVTCLKFAAGLVTFALPVMLLLIWLTNKLATGVLDCSKFPLNSNEHLSSCTLSDIVKKSIDTIKHGWIEYKRQPVLPASIAYVLLYFNVVLTPGGLMTAFLTQHGLNPTIIGGFSGLCASMGIAATFISATLVKHLGILKAGAAGLIFQASVLTLGVAVYWSGPLSKQTPLLFFLFSIVLSRLGHMSYDVVSAQILQTGIPSMKVNLIGATEVSMASLAEFVMLGVVIVANDVSHFGFLAMLSLASVFGATWMFCKWLANPTEDQKKLFTFDTQFEQIIY